MSTPTLWTIPVQPKGKPIRAAAVIGGVPFKLPDAYTHYDDNLKPPFLGKFPHGKIPAWEDGDFLLFEWSAIARYVASKAPNSNLLGSTPEEAAQVDQWIHLAESEVDIYTVLANHVCNGKIAGYSKPAHTYFLEKQLRALKTLDAHLAKHTFFVGERITLADLSIAAFIQCGASISIDASVRAQLPHLIRHLETIVNQPQLKEIYGPINYTEKGVQFVPPKKEKAPAPPKEKKAEEKKPKKKEVEDDDADEPDVPPEPKVKNPLDDLPKSTFNLEDWKRAYSNKDTRGAGGSIEWFYQNFDAEGFSIYRVDFKYNDELTQTFMSSNQIGGFFNRLEASRKYLFGSVGVLGQTNDSVISGVLILRGQDVAPVVNVAPDWESYKYEKIDLKDEKQKAFFEGALAWDLELDGKKWVDGKNFK
ncbi:elongation factor 1-gamma [Armillaria gallica]|uniref:Elongation factor 1-gamma n=1 Tax=Armillaria gallica TaxID=47427 RepID=A0A2H3CRE5_ARMGA|nr:elongation factor 1-gamma [Armillaria gallica]